jgi:hypothetical protein
MFMSLPFNGFDYALYLIWDSALTVETLPPSPPLSNVSLNGQIWARCSPECWGHPDMVVVRRGRNIMR